MMALFDLLCFALKGFWYIDLGPFLYYKVLGTFLYCLKLSFIWFQALLLYHIKIFVVLLSTIFFSFLGLLYSVER